MSNDKPSEPGAASGMEMMLRSMGLASVLDAAKALAQSGAVQKIMKFADDLEGTNEQLNERLARIEERLGLSPWDAGKFGDGVRPDPLRLRAPDDAARTGTDDG